MALLANMEAERVVLGAVLVSSEALPSAVLKASDFSTRPHRVVWESVLRLEEKGVPIDMVTLKNDLQARGEFQAVGGPAFLGSLVDGLPRVENLEHWSSIIRDGSRLRTVVNAAEMMLAKAQNGEANGHEVLEEGMALLGAVAVEVGGAVDLNTANHAAEAHAALLAGRSHDRGWGTGLAALDAKAGALLPGHLWIVGARTGIGKSTLLQNIGEAVSTAGGRVLLFSAEMSRSQIYKRRLLAESRVPSNRFERGGVTPTPSELERLKDAEAELAQRAFVIEASAPAPVEMKAKCRFVKSAIGLDVVMADYMQLFPSGPGRKNENREQEVARVSRSMKRLAMDLNVSVVAAAQLNRSPEGRKEGRPRLSDLRESGSQEQDADVVLLLHQDEDDTDVEIIVAKNRDRGPAKVKVAFSGAIHRFDDLPSEWGEA